MRERKRRSEFSVWCVELYKDVGYGNAPGIDRNYDFARLC